MPIACPRPLALVAVLIAMAVASAGPVAGEVQIRVATVGGTGVVGPNFEADEFSPWFEAFHDAIEAGLAGDPGPRRVLVQVSWVPGEAGAVEVGALPALDEDARTALLERLAAHAPPVARTVDLTLRFWVATGGAELEIVDLARLEPVPSDPPAAERARFESADLAGRTAALVDWSRRRGLPLLGEVARSVDARFEGVVGLGRAIGALEGQLDVAALTDRNPIFWRAAMEMGPGDQLVVALRILLHVAEGRFDHAARHLLYARVFSRNGTAADGILERLSWRLSIFREGLDAAIAAGIELHDAGRFDEAIAHYEAILEAYPHSAMARYEIYFSRQVKSGPTPGDAATGESWNAAAPAIYADDPLFHIKAYAFGPAGKYEFVLRMEQQGLFAEPSRLGDDLFRWADIALDLGVRDVAAHLYLLLYSHLPDDQQRGRDLMAWTLYALQPFEVDEVMEFFERDFGDDFDKIAAIRKAAMRDKVGTDGEGDD